MTTKKGIIVIVLSVVLLIIAVCLFVLAEKQKSKPVSEVEKTDIIQNSEKDQISPEELEKIKAVKEDLKSLDDIRSAKQESATPIENSDSDSIDSSSIINPAVPSTSVEDQLKELEALRNAN